MVLATPVLAVLDMFEDSLPELAVLVTLPALVALVTEVLFMLVALGEAVLPPSLLLFVSVLLAVLLGLLVPVLFALEVTVANNVVLALLFIPCTASRTGWTFLVER